MGINKDQVAGRAKQTGGAVREAAGRAVGNKTAQAKGMVEKNAGAAQAKYGDLKEKVKDASKADRR
jgi:uncharacterized protein YjbJ (UPF0337 family)